MVTNDEFYYYARELDEFSSIFYQLWRMGKPQFTDKIPTAAVSFDKSGKFINFMFNENFWNSLSNYERMFVICHECLHVLLNHGERGKDFKQKDILNICMDIVINELLLRKFGFILEKLPNIRDTNLCLVDTIFKEKAVDIRKNGSFEYYLVELMKIVEKVPVQYIMLDDHSGLEGISKGDMEDIIESIGEVLQGNEGQKLLETLLEHSEDINKYAGKNGGGHWVIAKAKYKPKKKWETIIKNWSKKAVNDKHTDQWIKEHRRFLALKKEFFLPTEAEIEEYEKTKINVWFFQDTSGSCQGFIDRFFSAAKSLPKEKFDVKMHCFDTRVYETTLESGKLYGFGGTYFDILEKYVQQEVQKKGIPYPKAIFVITDGYGNAIKPQHPERWHWFLSTGYKDLIHKDCKIYNLGDYE